MATGTLSVAQGRIGQGAQELGDPDYGVCRGVDARCYHDWGNFDTTKGYKVLLYTRTAGPRHANLGPAPARPPAPHDTGPAPGTRRPARAVRAQRGRSSSELPPAQVELVSTRHLVSGI
ncbi:hypothetical protein ACWC24_35485 [Streptomyces sp. NPDC001443]